MVNIYIYGEYIYVVKIYMLIALRCIHAVLRTYSVHGEEAPQHPSHMCQCGTTNNVFAYIYIYTSRSICYIYMYVLAQLQAAVRRKRI